MSSITSPPDHKTYNSTYPLSGMDKLILISDVHGNGPALKALMEKEPDGTYVFLGDLHGLNAFPVSA